MRARTSIASMRSAAKQSCGSTRPARRRPRAAARRSGRLRACDGAQRLPLRRAALRRQQRHVRGSAQQLSERSARSAHRHSDHAGAGVHGSRAAGRRARRRGEFSQAISCCDVRPGAGSPQTDDLIIDAFHGGALLSEDACREQLRRHCRRRGAASNRRCWFTRPSRRSSRACC